MDPLAQAYNEFFEKKVLTEHPEYYEFAANLCRGKTLDVACANGGWLLERSPGSIGVDFSFVAIRQIRAKNLLGVVGDAHSLPFKNDAFDTIVSLGSLEHFRDPEMAISEMGRVLKKGGALVPLHQPQGRAPFHAPGKNPGDVGEISRQELRHSTC